MDPTDESLVQACRSGDGAAWGALVARYQRLVYAIPRKIGLDEQACDDVFQHVFVRLLEHLDRIENPARLGVWIVTTTKHEAWRLARQARRVTTLADDDQSAAPLLDENPLPDEVAERLVEQHEVRIALAALDARCRTLLTALYYEPEPPSYAELAARVGLPEGSIGPTRARCLEKLRRLLKPRLQ
jgi:RNA polymerase sigma factor (sigma-70 family)